MFKRTIQRTLQLLGYRLVRVYPPAVVPVPPPKFDPVAPRPRQPQVRFDNFVNLALTHERRLNAADPDSVPPNANRMPLLAQLLGTPPIEAYFIIQSMARCIRLPGDVCEFGVAQGATSTLIANEIGLADSKRLHLFDSFEGLPKPSDKDALKDDIFSLGSIGVYAGTMANKEELVRSRLQAISFPVDRYVVHKGFVETVFQTGEGLPSQVCFAYVDLDFYEPIKLTLEFLHPRLPPGAIVMVDDYDFFSTGAKTAVDEWLAEQNATRLVYECFVPNPMDGNFAILTKLG
jgi:hypothetical protein